MSESTPGPWSVVGEPIPVEPVPGYPVACTDGAYFPIAHVFSDEPDGRANAYLTAAAPTMRDALRLAEEALDDNMTAYCECDDCEQCGKPVAECSGTECSSTCQCSTCRYCITEMAYDAVRAALAATTPPAAQPTTGAEGSAG